MVSTLIVRLMPGNMAEFIEGVTKSFFMVGVSEIGDKTFFIAAVLAMTNSRRQVFLGAAGALVTMTLLSVVFGMLGPAFFSKAYTHHAATALFFVFGVRTLWSAWEADQKAAEELEEVEADLAAKSKKDAKAKSNRGASGRGKRSEEKLASTSLLGSLVGQLCVETFAMTFLAEWGDKSQLATIGLAAQEHPAGVALGGCLGHCVCSLVAVVGGRAIARYCSQRVIALFGGLLFLGFGIFALVGGPHDH